MPANDAIAQLSLVVNASTVKARGEVDALASSTRAAGRQMKADMMEAKGSIQLLGEEVGIAMPRHLRTFVAGLPGVATAMSAAFNAVAVIALAKVVYEAGEKVYEFAKKGQEAAQKSAGAWRELTGEAVKSNAQLSIANDRLQNDIAKLSGRPENGLKLALDEAKLSAIDLADELEKAVGKERELLDSGNANWFQRVAGTAGTDTVKSGLDDYQNQSRRVNGDYDERLKSAKSLAAEEEIERQRKQALLDLTNAYYNSLTKEIGQRKELAAILGKPSDSLSDAERARYRELNGQFAASGSNGDQSKILPALQNLQGRIGVGATSLDLEQHHDQLEQQDEAARASKSASDKAAKNAKELDSAWKEMAHSIDEAWTKRQEDAKRTETLVQESAKAIMAAWKEEDEDQTRSGARWKEYNKLLEESGEIKLKAQAASDASRIRFQEETGAITKQAAAMAQLNVEINLRNSQMAAIAADSIEAANDTTLSLPEAETRVRQDNNKFTQLQGEKGARELQLTQLQQSGTALQSLRTSALDLANQFTDMPAIIKRNFDQVFSSINDAILKVLTERDSRGAFRAAGHQIFTGVAQSGLQYAEGSVMKTLFGSASGVKLGTKNNPMFVQMAAEGAPGSGGGGLIGGLLTKIFGGGAAATSSASVGGSSIAQNLGTAMGLLGSFAGMFAGGGDIPSGGWGIAGERGPEIIHGPSRVTPMGAMGGDVHNHFAPTIHVNGGGNPAETVALIHRELRPLMNDFDRMAVNALRNHNSRVPSSKRV